MDSDLDGRLRAEGLEPGRWSNGPGDRYAAHDHGYDKVIVVERGSIRFGLGSARPHSSSPRATAWSCPAGTLHDALVGSSGVVCLEAHRPVRLAPRGHSPSGRDVVTATRSRPG